MTLTVFRCHASISAAILLVMSIVLALAAQTGIASAAGQAVEGTSAPAPAVGVFAAPPPGGVTLGISGTTDPAALVRAQPFAVQSVSAFDRATQRWLTYLPGAPARVNTLHAGNLRADTIVAVRRAVAGSPSPSVAPVAAATPAPAPSPTVTTVVAQRAAATSTSALPVDVEAEAAMLRLLNQERVAAGLHPLLLDRTIVPVARAHSLDMWQRNYFAHVNLDGVDPFARMRAGGVTFSAAGENLARAATTERAHDALMASEGHRKNILEPRFRRIGIGVIANGTQGRMFTQNFAD